MSYPSSAPSTIQLNDLWPVRGHTLVWYHWTVLPISTTSSSNIQAFSYSDTDRTCIRTDLALLPQLTYLSLYDPLEFLQYWYQRIRLVSWLPLERLGTLMPCWYTCTYECIVSEYYLVWWIRAAWLWTSTREYFPWPPIVSLGSPKWGRVVNATESRVDMYVMKDANGPQLV